MGHGISPSRNTDVILAAKLQACISAIDPSCVKTQKLEIFMGRVGPSRARENRVTAVLRGRFFLGGFFSRVFTQPGPEAAVQFLRKRLLHSLRL